jgi:uncharacterized phage-associated protein
MGHGYISNLKLQRLLYAAHGWHLAINGTPLLSCGIFADEYGPISKIVYDRLINYGDKLIKIYLPDIIYADDEFRQYIEMVKDPFVEALINRIIEVYGKLSVEQLSNWAHASNSPYTIMANNDIVLATIPDALIKKYFKSMANK